MSFESAHILGRGSGSSSLDRLTAGTRSKAASWALPLLVACALILYFLNTRHGIGILPDSTRYMSINDRPYDAPIYPWLLKLVALSGVGLVKAAWIIGAVLVALNTVLAWQLIMAISRSFVAALLGSALVMVAPTSVALHASAMSEPLFLTFIMGTLLVFRQYLVWREVRWLAATAVMVALSSLVRFTAPPLGAAIALTILLQPGTPLSRKLKDALTFGLIAAAIFFAWVIGSELTAGHSTGREMQFNGTVGRKEWLIALEAIAAWILPDKVPLALRTLIIVPVLLLGFALSFRLAWAGLAGSGEKGERSNIPATLPLALALFVPIYMGFLVLATMIEANLEINSRYALPAYASTVILLSATGAQVARRSRTPWVAIAFAGFGLAVLASHATRTAIRTSEAYRDGIGYTSAQWAQSPTLLALQRLPASALIWSNGPEAVEYVIGRPAHFVPERVQLRTNKPNPRAPYEAQLERLRRILDKQGGYIVFLDRIDWRFYLGREDELVRRLGLRRIATTADGRIYEPGPKR